MRTRAPFLLLTPLVALALVACSSGSTPESSTEASAPAPTAAEQATAGSGDAGDAPADFCASIAGISGIDAKLLAATTRLSTVIEDSDTWEDPATLDALHATGQEVLDEVPGVAAYYETTASQVDDPEVASALRAMGDLYGVYFAAMAQEAVDATDVMGYAMGVLEITSDETLSAVMSDGADAAYVVGDYTASHCTQ